MWLEHLSRPEEDYRISTYISLKKSRCYIAISVESIRSFNWACGLVCCRRLILSLGSTHSNEPGLSPVASDKWHGTVMVLHSRIWLTARWSRTHPSDTVSIWTLNIHWILIWEVLLWYGQEVCVVEHPSEHVLSFMLLAKCFVFIDWWFYPCKW